MKRRLCAAALALAAVVFCWMVPAAPAYALPGSCDDPPQPVPPKSGLPGLLTPTPAEIPPAGADPFADPTIPIADVYGTSWHWSVYDMGMVCDPVALVNTSQANMTFGIASAMTATVGGMEDLATEYGLGWFSDWATRAAAALEPIVFGGPTPSGVLMGLFPMMLLVLAGWVIWRGDRLSAHELAQRVAVAAACLALATVSLVAPGWAAHRVDDAAKGVATVAGASFNASLTDGVDRQAIYRAWLAGQFGDPDTELAREAGPRVIKATRYSWAEWNQIQANPAAREGVDKAKADEYRAVADEVKERDPSAYLNFQGRGERAGPAVFGVLVGGFIALFAMIAFGLTIAARLVMLLLVIAAPVGALFGLLPQGEVTLKKMWDLFVACLIVVFKFTLAAGVMAIAFGLVSSLDPIRALLWMLILTIVALKFLRPVHAFKAITPGMDPNTSYIKKLVKWAVKTILTALTGGAAAGAVAGSVVADREEKSERERVELRRVPPDRPEFRQLPDTPRHEAIGRTPRAEIDTGPGWAGVLPPGPPPAPAGSAGQYFRAPERITANRVVIEGEVVGAGRDRGSDLPAGEVVRYRSARV